MERKAKVRNIILPHGSYTTIDEERIDVSSLRVAVNPKIEKFVVGLVNEQIIVKQFTIKDLTIRVYNEEDVDQDVLEFVNKQKKTIAQIYFAEKHEKNVYQKYIQAMMI